MTSYFILVEQKRSRMVSTTRNTQFPITLSQLLTPGCKGIYPLPFAQVIRFPVLTWLEITAAMFTQGTTCGDEPVEPAPAGQLA
jgi:hypothetical protein